jgi:hypothetical protein
MTEQEIDNMYFNHDHPEVNGANCSEIYDHFLGWDTEDAPIKTIDSKVKALCLKSS